MVLFLRFLGHFIYDHLLEGISVALTFLALLISLGSFTYTNWRIKSEEMKKNKKTLKLFDSLTKKERENTFGYSCKLDKIEMDFVNYEEIEYTLTLRAYRNPIKSNNEKAFIIDKAMDVIFENNIKSELNAYLNTIKANLESNHVNLNNNSLEKVTNKITDLNVAVKLCEKFANIDQVYNDILAENQLPIKDQCCTDNLYNSYKKLKETLKQLSDDL